MFITLYFI